MRRAYFKLRLQLRVHRCLQGRPADVARIATSSGFASRCHSIDTEAEHLRNPRGKGRHVASAGLIPQTAARERGAAVRVKPGPRRVFSETRGPGRLFSCPSGRLELLGLLGLRNLRGSPPQHP